MVQNSEGTITATDTEINLLAKSKKVNKRALLGTLSIVTVAVEVLMLVKVTLEMRQTMHSLITPNNLQERF